MRKPIALGIIFAVCMSLSSMGVAGASTGPLSTDTVEKAKTRQDSGAGHAVVRPVATGRGSAAMHPARSHPTRRLDQAPQRGPSVGGTTKSTAHIPQGAAPQASATAASLDTSAGTLESGLPGANAPVLGGTFLGTTECCSIPPDPTMAAGPFQVVVATNDGYAAFDKNGTAVPNTVAQPCAGSCSLGTFFTNAVAGAGIFDPWLVYDQYIDRYWLLAVSEADSPQNSDFLLALSNSSDVTDGWSLFRIDARTNANDVQSQWCDYEKLGVDAQAIYLTCNMFSFPQGTGDFQYAKIRAMTKSQFLNGTCCFWWDWWNLREGFAGVYKSFSIQPAHMYGASAGDGEFLVNAFNTCVFCPAY